MTVYTDGHRIYLIFQKPLLREELSYGSCLSVRHPP